MKRQLLVLFTLVAMLVCAPAADAFNGRGGGHGGHGHGRGFGGGIGRGLGGIGIGGFDYGWDIAELYRELYNNLPFYALHPPVYYSCPVPRTYGYSPFAYPPGVMTPDVVFEVQPVTINNPYVPSAEPTGAPVTPPPDRAAAVSKRIEPLVIINPYVTQSDSVARSER